MAKEKSDAEQAAERAEAEAEAAATNKALDAVRAEVEKQRGTSQNG